MLFLAQFDDVPGELVGFVLEKLTDAGCKNVQIIPTLTKKGRPGYILLVDGKNEEKIKSVLIDEVGITGYHVIKTTHVTQPLTFKELLVEVKSYKGNLSFRVSGKESVNTKGKRFVKAEFDSLIELKRRVEKELEISVDIKYLKNYIESQAKKGLKRIILDLD